VAATFALLSSLFWGDRPAVATVFAVGWIVTAGLAAAAAARPRLLPFSFALDGVTLAASLAFFAVCPSTFLKGF
jgi:hypothetical protein